MLKVTPALNVEAGCRSHCVNNSDSAFSVPLYNRKKTEACLAFRYQEELCCCSVTKLCPTLCDPMDCSTPGSSVLHCLLEFAQIHVHSVGDAIQPSHPLLPPSFPALNLYQHQGLLNESDLHSPQVAKVLEFHLQHQSFKRIFRTDYLEDRLVESPFSPRDSRVFSNSTVQKQQFFGTQLSL